MNWLKSSIPSSFGAQYRRILCLSDLLMVVVVAGTVVVVVEVVVEVVVVVVVVVEVVELSVMSALFEFTWF